jgi:tripartite tricarboxylate transporter TctB family protein
MRKTEIVTALVLMAFGLGMIFFIIPAQTDPGEEYGLAPSFFPNFSMTLIILFALALLVKNLKKPRKQPARADAPAPIQPGEWIHLGWVVAFLLLGLVSIGLFGYSVGGIVIITAFMLYMRERRILRIAVVAIPVPLLIYHGVWKILSIPLP